LHSVGKYFPFRITAKTQQNTLKEKKSAKKDKKKLQGNKIKKKKK
jgi:hypothetical protein